MFGSCVRLKIWTIFCTSGSKRLKVWRNTDQREKCNTARHQTEQLCFNNVRETVCSRAVSNNEAEQHVACSKTQREMARLLDCCAHEAWLIHLCSVRFGGFRSNNWLLPNRVQLQQILSLQSLPLLRASCPNTDIWVEDGETAALSDGHHWVWGFTVNVRPSCRVWMYLKFKADVTVYLDKGSLSEWRRARAPGSCSVKKWKQRPCAFKLLQTHC